MPPSGAAALADDRLLALVQPAADHDERRQLGVAAAHAAPRRCRWSPGRRRAAACRRGRRRRRRCRSGRWCRRRRGRRSRCAATAGWRSGRRVWRSSETTRRSGRRSSSSGWCRTARDSRGERPAWGPRCRGATGRPRARTGGPTSPCRRTGLPASARQRSRSASDRPNTELAPICRTARRVRPWQVRERSRPSSSMSGPPGREGIVSRPAGREYRTTPTYGFLYFGSAAAAKKAPKDTRAADRARWVRCAPILPAYRSGIGGR